MSNRYSLYPATFVHGGGTLTLVQIGAASAAMNSNFDEITVGGTVDRGAVILQTAAPSATFQTADLATAFGVISPTFGLSCTGQCKLQYQKRADQAVYAGGSTNGVATAQNGFLLPTSLSAGNSGRASLGLMFHSLFDGTNEPFVFAANQALSGVAGFNSAFYHAPVYVNGVAIDGNLSVSIDFGLRVTPVYEDGVVFPTLASITSRNPTISLSFSKLEHSANTIGSLFTGALAGTIAVYFQKGSPSGKRVAAASSVHCKVSATTGQWGIDDVPVSGEDDATISVTCRPTSALSVSVTSAIP